MFGKRKQGASEHASAFGPAGKRAYVIGDVHGCHAELVRLLDLIREDLSDRETRTNYIVFLGDLIDRGPASREVVDMLLHEPPDFAKPLFIRGNHEDSLIRGLRGEPQLLPSWLEYGGTECAVSYGLSPHMISGQSVEALEHALLSHIPAEHIDFLDSFLDSVEFGDYLLVHAGVRPGVSLSAQTSRDMRWIREPFLSSKANFGKMVVHGHTVVDRVDIRPNRIAVDTGVYKSGLLSAIRLEDDQVQVIEARVT